MAPKGPPEIQAALRTGFKTLSGDQQITFTPYIRTVLQDGLVFWVNAALTPNNELEPKTVSGSLHYAAEKRQTETGSVTTTRVVFTTQVNLHENIEETDPTVIWIGEVDGIRFTFASFNEFYNQANTWHYVGDAIYADMLSQIIDDPNFDTDSQALSNSMPLWLAFSNYTPTNPAYGYSFPVTVYPAFLVPINNVPPYAVVEVLNSESICGTPFETSTSSDYALTRDRVKMTVYGLRNEQARRIIMAVIQRSVDYNQFGIENSPVVVDDKQNQVELGILAMRKTIEFVINYNQGAARDIARQMIVKAIPSFVGVNPSFGGLPDPYDPVTRPNDETFPPPVAPSDENTFTIYDLHGDVIFIGMPL